MTRTTSSLFVCLLALLLAPAAGAAEDAVSFPVQFETEDGFVLHGDLTSAGGAESPVAILLHMYRHDRTSWAALVPELVRKGITVLALDQRAHGRSTRRGEETIRVEEISREAFGGVVRDGVKDVRAALAYLRSRGIAAERLALVGASYGCTVSLLATREIEGVDALVLLSPGTDYFGVPVRDLALAYRGPVMAVAAEDDPAAAAAARSLTNGRRGPSDLRLYPEGGHGTRLFAAHEDLAVHIRAFLRPNLGLAPRD